MNPEKQLFKLLNERTSQKWKKFSKYYINDSKSFINKISRDYEHKSRYMGEGFPVHVLQMINKIRKKDYDSAVCILRGALPYTILFEAAGWKVHYVICGRKNEKVAKTEMGLRFNKNADKSLKQIKGKKILLIENNSLTGNTPYRVALELKKEFGISKPDLFLDYFIRPKIGPLTKVKQFYKNRERIKKFGKIYEASKLKVSPKKRATLIEDFLKRLKN